MQLQQAYYEERFKNRFARARGMEFQKLFEELMGLAFKGDFFACRPWGQAGDWKNDGYLQSKRCLFQVYAPNELDVKKTVEKIQTDFEGAKPYWSEHFDKWVFVHNSVEGLPPQVIQCLLDLDKANREIEVSHWGEADFLEVFRRLTPEDLSTWLGPPVNDAAQSHVMYKDIEMVLESLSCNLPVREGPVREVPPGKIAANDLSESVTTLLKCGMSKAHLVAQFLERYYDETLGERLASAFRAEYARLRGTMHPNRIFGELQTWVAGSGRGTPEHQVASLAVLAYSFERCDIFEEPKP